MKRTESAGGGPCVCVRARGAQSDHSESGWVYFIFYITGDCTAGGQEGASACHRFLF